MKKVIKHRLQQSRLEYSALDGFLNPNKTYNSDGCTQSKSA